VSATKEQLGAAACDALPQILKQLRQHYGGKHNGVLYLRDETKGGGFAVMTDLSPGDLLDVLRELVTRTELAIEQLRSGAKGST